MSERERESPSVPQEPGLDPRGRRRLSGVEEHASKLAHRQRGSEAGGARGSWQMEARHGLWQEKWCARGRASEESQEREWRVSLACAMESHAMPCHATCPTGKAQNEMPE